MLKKLPLGDKPDRFFEAGAAWVIPKKNAHNRERFPAVWCLPFRSSRLALGELRLLAGLSQANFFSFYRSRVASYKASAAQFAA